MNVIIFKIEINADLGGFAQASNFIFKMSNKISLNNNEVKDIKSMQIRDAVNLNYKETASMAIRYYSKFKPVERPENLSQIGDDYQIMYCLWINQDSLLDIVDMQYDCLIKKYFEKEYIFSILSANQKLYHTISHYLYDVSYKFDDLYNSIYYLDNRVGNKLIRLQKRNVGGLKDFMPMQYFSNKDNILFAQIDSCFTREEFTDLLLEKDNSKKYAPSIQGALELLKVLLKHFEAANRMQLVDLIYTGNMFSFLIFAFLTSEMKENNNEFNYLKQYYSKIREYVSGCEQLIENSLHHSTSGCGSVSIRRHSANASYLKARYGEDKAAKSYMEILVTDYAGVNAAGNMADTFRENLKSEGSQEGFENLVPIDFFDNQEETERAESIRDAFFKYYRSSEHIGKHIGLKVFKTIVEENEGIFGFYSHRGHKIGEGENYHFIEYNKGAWGAQCLPGTGYTVLFPITREINTTITRAEISIDSNSYFEDNIDFFKKGYNCEEKKLDDSAFHFDNQEEKENMISDLSRQFGLERLDGEKQRIIYISAGKLSDEAAEYIAKSLMIAGSEAQIPDYVFYNCDIGFVTTFQKTMAIYFGMKELNYIYRQKEFVIALYTGPKIVQSCFFIPGYLQKSLWVNRRNGYAGNRWKGIEGPDSDIKKNSSGGVEAEQWKDVPPYDILHELEETETKRTIFEQYTLQVLDTNIQERRFGCKMTNTHMRLGSTIHIDCFYEAELIFANRLFINRFAYILIEEIRKEPKFIQSSNVTLYSYALYSEALIFEMLNILEKLYPQKDIDYAILEREAEHREFTHIDRIRYSTAFRTKEEKLRHFKERDIICIVPINSTLKTHEKLLFLFEKDNPGVTSKNIILNYAIILVGSRDENKYWRIDETERTFKSIALNINPVPHYFIAVKVKYYEALGCELCFPPNPLDETPLVEVNAASTIPNQAFGLLGQNEERPQITYRKISDEENRIKILRNSLIYSHTQRGENHYLYYFKTDELFVEYKADIIKWLKDIALKIKAGNDEYHILFCPAHFSNAGFLECVNKVVFHDAALIIRVDVDKEFRSNICAKYSNLAAFIDLLSEEETKERLIKIYYIDDSIITGRTFYRAKSLMSSVVEQYKGKRDQINIHIFEKVIVLLDRNSKQSRLQYIECWDSKNKSEEKIDDNFFAFRTLNISSMRNHGDSCTLCQLEREAALLYRTSATKKMTDYWKHARKKFGVHLLRDKEEENEVDYDRKDDKKDCSKKGEDSNKAVDKAYRRMFCSHLLATVMSGASHGNRKEDAIPCFLELLIEDYFGRAKESQEEAFEYFLSYLKIISRPFLVFNRTIKESAFDVLLVLTESLLTQRSNREIIEGTHKKYLAGAENLFETIIDSIIRKEFSAQQKMDLMLLLMKQLTEMKSNYFIRSQNIQKIADFAEKYDSEQQGILYRQYLQQTKKILGVSSDTSKSAWFGHELCSIQDKLRIPTDILRELILENTRAYFDGIDKLYHQKLPCSGEVVKYLTEERWNAPEKSHLEESAKAEINNELQKAQYRDFVSVLKDMGYVKNQAGTDKNQINTDGTASVLAGVQLYQLCREENIPQKNIENICFNIACLIEKILRAQNVKIILECPLECDKWEDNVRKTYNDFVHRYLTKEEKDEQKFQGLRMELKKKKEYLVIADSSVKQQEIMEGVKLSVAERLIACRETMGEKAIEFYVDTNSFVWEIGGDDDKRNEIRKLLIYAEFDELSLPKDLHILRNLVCMNYMLKTTVFDIESRDYLFELILADKERLMYNMDKTHSHTASKVKSAQCELVQTEEERIGIEGCYRSFVLTLLADLQISQIYRESLKEGYYCRDLIMKSRKCEEVFGFFYQKRPIVTLEQETNAGKIYLKVCVEIPEHGIFGENEAKLNKEDRVLTYNMANGGNEILLLIAALIMNAAGPQRGIRESSAQNNVDEVKVYLLKSKEGCLRIMNQCKEEKDVTSINAELNYPPQGNQGISLWSVSRYIKGMVSILIHKKLKNLREKIQGMENCDIIKELEEFKQIVENIWEKPEFRVRTGTACDKDGNKYFYMDIPILTEIYNGLPVE